VSRNIFHGTCYERLSSSSARQIGVTPSLPDLSDELIRELGKAMGVDPWNMQAGDPPDKLLANKMLSSPVNLIRIGAKPLIACARIERQFQVA
jgi:hypothetical protein